MMVKKYNEYIKEGLSEFLTGPSEEEVWNEIKNLRPNEMLLKSAKIGLFNGVKNAFELGANINYQRDYALIYSAAYGYLDIVKFLVEHGADIHSQNNYALRSAVSYGNYDIVKYLIEHGADIHTENENAIKTASSKGYLDIVKYLVEHGADIHSQDDYATRISAQYGYLDIVKYLVEHGADIHSQDYALWFSVQNNHLDVVKYLIEHGANIHAKKGLLNSSVKYPDMHKYLKEQFKKEKLSEGLSEFLKGPTEEEHFNYIMSLDGVVFLTKYGKYSEYNFKIDNDFSKYYQEKLYSKFKDVIFSLDYKTMLEKSVKYNFLDGVKKAFDFLVLKNRCLSEELENAIGYGHFEIATFLLKNGVQIKGYGTERIIQQLSHDNNYEILELVLKNGLDEYYSHRIKGLLSDCVSLENYETVKLLLEYEIGFGFDSDEMLLSLKIAIVNKNNKIIQVLIENGANLNRLEISFIKKMYINGSPKIRKAIKKIPGILNKLDVKYYDEKYKDYINEGLSDFLTGPSDEELLNNLKGLSDSNRIRMIVKLGKEYYKYLPDNLIVEGNLNCGNNRLTSLPDNLTVKGGLDCYGNQLTSLPDNLTVGGFLICSYNKLTYLPDNLTVGGSLDCSYNKLTYLPDNLTVNGSLDCSNNKIKLEIPKSAKIKGKIYN